MYPRQRSTLVASYRIPHVQRAGVVHTSPCRGTLQASADDLLLAIFGQTEEELQTVAVEELGKVFESSDCMTLRGSAVHGPQALAAAVLHASLDLQIRDVCLLVCGCVTEVFRSLLWCVGVVMDKSVRTFRFRINSTRSSLCFRHRPSCVTRL